MIDVQVIGSRKYSDDRWEVRKEEQTTEKTYPAS